MLKTVSVVGHSGGIKVDVSHLFPPYFIFILNVNVCLVGFFALIHFFCVPAEFF